MSTHRAWVPAFIEVPRTSDDRVDVRAYCRLLDDLANATASTGPNPIPDPPKPARKPNGGEP
jgi:hypothetical protein